MWNNISFKACSDAFFQYKIDGDLFFIKCELYNPSLKGGKVRVHSKSSECELGSFKSDRGLLLLDKTYPVSFLVSNGIEADAITHFSIETSDGNVILSEMPNELINTLENAKNLLDKMKDAPSYEMAQSIINEIKIKISSFKKETLPFLKDFEWHRVEDIKEVFSLSAIRHIVFSPSFLQSFEKSGFWLMGYRDNIFAICIKGEKDLPNPMENALDCCVSFEENENLYYAVGLGLFDDGQYFLRL